MKGSTILVIDDDERVRSLVRRTLERVDATVVEAPDGQRGLRALYGSRPDLVLLDIGMPSLDGWQTLTRIRELSDVPVAVVSGHSDELEKVRALRSGADDYITKPFGVQELTARAEALLRRARKAVGSPKRERPQRYADALVEIDFHAAEARAGGKPLGLTPLEFRLLSAFTRHPNQVLSADQLLELAWGERGFARDRVKIYVGYLRAKFQARGVEAPIETVRGFGYRYRTA